MEKKPLIPAGKTALHGLLLATSVLLIFFWVNNDKLSYFSLQFTAVLLLTLIITHHILKPLSYKLVESVISTMSVLLVTASTGGLASPLFFLNNFLLFEMSLLLEPLIPLILSAALIFFYIFSATAQQSLFNWLELLSFPVMTPLAIYLGNLYQKIQNQKKELHKLSEKINDLEEEIVEEELKKS